MEQPRGILRNKADTSPLQVHEVGDHLDRQEVIRNTQLNAHLVSESQLKGDQIRAKIAARKKSFGSAENSGYESEQSDNQQPKGSDDHLKWDEINLYQTEQEKAATMKIDEPKTPYEGGFNPEGEYYRDDEDEAGGALAKGGLEDIPAFELGDSEFDKNDTERYESLNGGEVIRSPELEEQQQQQQQESEERQLTAEERHQLFEAKRKAHYHLKALPLKHKILVPDEEEGT
ncbi:uncharacterized protein KQ657_001744 [Scheffersomyces spartinae]|uniref:Uncharacterized protein n=1 Tax=Scheffersomyces spartinae TaxID=45513 RepID=A0A9P7V6Z1_9ASCO|nr:uncharacterized protein KQ657_001744 [Scheffersomyces spartinae]KAG7192346.1 hypothetical protein KQ657_001744 [Scheffersomyces spartinae]